MQQSSNFSPPQIGVLLLAVIVLLFGIGIILGAPWLTHRLFSKPRSTTQTSSVGVFWAKIWCIDLIACTLLLTAVNAFRWLPFLPIVLKAGLIIVASLVLSILSSWLAWKRRERE